MSLTKLSLAGTEKSTFLQRTYVGYLPKQFTGIVLPIPFYVSTGTIQTLNNYRILLEIKTLDPVIRNKNNKIKEFCHP
jgi:hypothetical protein